jgi:hypothetical protein
VVPRFRGARCRRCGSGSVPGDSADRGAAGTVDLGRLKGHRGDQQDAIPAGVREVSGRALVTWCHALGASFGSAHAAWGRQSAIW